MSNFPNNSIAFLHLFHSSRKQIETATEEIFGTDSSLDTTPVHPHIVRLTELFNRSTLCFRRFHV